VFVVDFVKNGLADTNRSGQASSLMAITPITPGKEAALRTYLRGLDQHHSPFAKLPRTHFARWVICDDFLNYPDQRHEEHLKCSYLIFSACHDGEIGSYLDELVEVLAPEAHQIWGRCINAPTPTRGPELKAYLLHNQINSGFFVAAYGQSTAPEVLAALDQQQRMTDFVLRAQSLDPAALQQQFTTEFVA